MGGGWKRRSHGVCPRGTCRGKWMMVGGAAQPPFAREPAPRRKGLPGGGGGGRTSPLSAFQYMAAGPLRLRSHARATRERLASGISGGWRERRY